MERKDILRHRRFDTPAYHMWVHARPTRNQPGKTRYMAAVQTAAQAVIASPISADDVEVEVLYSTPHRGRVRGDIDRVLKPTLDGLKGIAYIDDIQVRSVTATLFERTHESMLSGRVEYIGHLLYPGDRYVDIVLIAIHSDSRLIELGGEDAVRKARLETFLQSGQGG